MHSMLAVALAVSAFSGPLRAQTSAIAEPAQASFERALLEGRDALRLPDAARKIREDAAAAQLVHWLGWYDSVEREPGIGAAEMSRRLAGGAAGGLYDGVILGESHGVAEETEAGELFVRELLASGASVGAFLREQNLFPDTASLDARRVPVRTFRNQFDPEADVKAGLKAAGRGGLLVTYTGCAHTADAVKNFFLYTLEEGKTWGYGPGKRDMPTVEQAFARHGRRPIIVAMVQEETVLSKIQHLFLRNMAGDGADLAALRDELESLEAAWRARMALYPARPGPIAFVRSPGQANLYAGIAPADRRPVEIEAVRRVFALPELAAWLGAEPIRGVECLKGSSGGPSGPLEVHYDVLVHSSSGRTFARTIPGTELR